MSMHNKYCTFTALEFAHVKSEMYKSQIVPLIYYYLRQGEYVFSAVCLSVGRITQKQLNQFSWDLVEGWGMGLGRTR